MLLSMLELAISNEPQDEQVWTGKLEEYDVSLGVYASKWLGERPSLWFFLLCSSLALNEWRRNCWWGRQLANFLQK
jgi:hypothetical protein